MQPNRHSHGSGNLGRGVWATVLSDKFPCGQVRISACAGMTNFEIAVLSGMTGFEIAVLSERNRTVIPTEVGI
ncbi:hypothetical protein D6Z71_04590 [Neisseria gonorrhoeae]